MPENIEHFRHNEFTDLTMQSLTVERGESQLSIVSSDLPLLFYLPNWVASFSCSGVLR
jgi:hypothetical protein